MKANNPEKYAHVVIGRWADVAAGAVFKKWGIVDEFPAWAKKVAIGQDFGYTHDPSASIRCGIVDNAYIWMKWITVQDCYLLTLSRLFVRGA